MRVLLLGPTGRLGREIGTLLGSRGHDVIGLGRAETETARAVLSSQIRPYVLVDVSLPECSIVWADALARAEPAQRALCKGALIGVTGFNPAQIRILECLSEAVPWALVSNFSAGVHLFEEMLRATTSDGRSVVELARTLGFDLALWESHHTRKVDSPSGTAKSLADAAGIPHERIATTRVGAVVGEHVIFASAEGEELRFQHVAHTRVLFARGAVLMAERLSRANLAPSRYEKADILSLPEA